MSTSSGEALSRHVGRLKQRFAERALTLLLTWGELQTTEHQAPCNTALQHCMVHCNIATRLRHTIQHGVSHGASHGVLHSASHGASHQALAERLQLTRERRGAAQARSAEVRLLPPLLKEHGLP